MLECTIIARMKTGRDAYLANPTITARRFTRAKHQARRFSNVLTGEAVIQSLHRNQAQMDQDGVLFYDLLLIES